MRRSHKAQLDYVTRWLPLAFPLFAVTGLILLAWLQPDPIIGEVLRVREVNSETRVATVEYADTTGPRSVTIVEELELPTAHWDSEEVPIWPGNESQPARIGLFGRIRVTPTLIGLTAGIAALLGKVVEMTHRGFGYVRGSGKPGETRPVEVAEDRGFYWRT